MIKPSAVIVVTDGGKLSSLRSIKSEIELRSQSPGAELVGEPFRWDQRVFALVLKLNAHSDAPDAPETEAPSNTSILSGLCEDTGGKSFSGK